MVGVVSDFLKENGEFENVANYTAKYVEHCELSRAFPEFWEYSPIEALFRIGGSHLNVREALHALFTWSETEQGVDYWIKLSGLWVEYLADLGIDTESHFYFE